MPAHLNATTVRLNHNFCLKIWGVNITKGKNGQKRAEKRGGLESNSMSLL